MDRLDALIKSKVLGITITTFGIDCSNSACDYCPLFNMNADTIEDCSNRLKLLSKEYPAIGSLSNKEFKQKFPEHFI